jgi:hypothetical protein
MVSGFSNKIKIKIKKSVCFILKEKNYSFTILYHTYTLFNLKLIK